MILRKPYAFLIKYFQKINILLLVLIGFISYKLIKFSGFTKGYVDTGIYNSTLDSINNYINIYTILSLILILLISSILVFLLKRKDKPYISYLIIIIVDVLTLAMFIYSRNYFTFKVVNDFNIVSAKIVRDLSLINTIPYYPLLFLLLIRSIGLDFKSFGFNEDKEFLEVNESDREEVEVNVGLDKNKIKRKYKYYFRQFKYFYLEHKYLLTVIAVLLILLFTYNFYKYFYVDNRIYSMNEKFTSNNYNITISHTYLSDKDYAGNVIGENGRNFILVETTIKNLSGVDREFDYSKLLLYVDNNFYIPTLRYNDSFKDMGNLYKVSNGIVKGFGTVTYVFVYETETIKPTSNFLLKYQDLTSGDTGKLIKVKLKVLDIREFKDKGKFYYNNDASIPINENKIINFKLNDLSITDSIDYRYQMCTMNSTCPIVQGTITSGNNKKILYLKVILNTTSKEDFLNFVSNYGKIRYKVGEDYNTIPVTMALSKNYKGNYLYLIVPSEINESSYIEFIFTIRTYQYKYILRGE